MAKRKTKPVKGSWVVRMTCDVDKEVICEDCTEEEARNNPFEHAIDERELCQNEYEVTDVTSND